MKRIILFAVLLISAFSFGQETVKTNPKLELKIRENNRVTEVSRVSNNKVVERKDISRERRENHGTNLKNEKHRRPHFDKHHTNHRDNHKKEHVRKEHHSRERQSKEHHPRETNRERSNEHRNDRMEKHKIR